MAAANIAILVTVAIFLLGVTYQAGRLSARVESLESWREKMDTELTAIHSAIRAIGSMIRGEET